MFKNRFISGLLLAIVISLFVWAGPAFAQEDCGETYRIQRGDTLSKIAYRCDLNLDLMILINPQIKNPDLIFPGQILQLPAPSEEQSAILPSTGEDLDPDELEAGERWIDVDISQQTVYAMVGDEAVRSFVVSTGTRRYPTVLGRYKIYVKYRYDDMRGPGYFLKDVPYTMYFHRGYGLHGTYWHSNFGTPMSHGCINLTVDDASWLFQFAEVGTIVNVHN